jgi:hypothetical protein
MRDFEIKIDRNIEIPSPRSHEWGKWKRVSMEMKVGDSFLIPNGMPKDRASFFQSVGRYVDYKFTSRTMPDGIRIWRIK